MNDNEHKDEQKQNESSEDIQARIGKILSDKLNINAHPIHIEIPDAEFSPEEPEDSDSGPDPIEDFKLKPKEIKANLDRFVIRQDEAKKVLSVAVCDHYNHVRMRRIEEEKDDELQNYIKQNILIVGSTGVGKTYLIKCIADMVGVPFVKADATKFSETGYVGGDVDDLVRDLVDRAGGDVELAQYGIIYVDEIDKITATNQSLGRDVAGSGVQTGLLKLLEETKVPLKSPMDITAQFQSMMEMSRGGKKKRRKTINTKHILFIVSGAFEGLKDIIRRRVAERNIGFGSDYKAREDHELFEAAATEDFIKFGFEPEFVGRLPVRCVCENLSEEDLFNIMKSSEGSIIRQYVRAFGAFGIKCVFTDESLRETARLAAAEKTGARGILTVLERALRHFKFELPSSTVKAFAVTGRAISDSRTELKRLMENPEAAECEYLRLELEDKVKSFAKVWGFGIELEDSALCAYAKLSQDKKDETDLTEVLFPGCQYGLELLKKSGAGKIFTITDEVFASPQKVLDDLIRDCCKKLNK